MIRKNSIVLYKNLPAIVSNIEQDKYIIEFYSFAFTNENLEKIGKKGFTIQEQKVREKDITLLSIEENTTKYSLEDIIKYTENDVDLKIKETWELLSSDEETATSEIRFSELVQLIDSNYSDKKSWFLYSNLINSLHLK